MNNYKLKSGNMAIDRLVPLPGFDYDELPYMMVNREDVMDLHTGDIIVKLSNLKEHYPFGPIDKTDLLLTYKDDILHI